MNKVLCLLVIMLITSCASRTKKAMQLREITSKDQAKGCFHVATVTTSSSSNSLGGNPIADHGAKVKLYNMVAEHADTIFIVEKKGNFTGVSFKAFAYDCKSLSEEAKKLKIVFEQPLNDNCYQTKVIQKSYSLNANKIVNLKKKIKLYNEAAVNGNTLYIKRDSQTPTEINETNIVYKCSESSYTSNYVD